MGLFNFNKKEPEPIQTLKKLEKFDINVSKFVRDAISEKIKRDSILLSTITSDVFCSSNKLISSFHNNKRTFWCRFA